MEIEKLRDALDNPHDEPTDLWEAARSYLALLESGMYLHALPDGWRYDEITFDEDQSGLWNLSITGPDGDGFWDEAETLAEASLDAVARIGGAR